MHLQNEVPAVGSAFWRSQLSVDGDTWIRPMGNGVRWDGGEVLLGAPWDGEGWF